MSLASILSAAGPMLGHRLWSLAAFAFPALALVQNQSVVLAMLLFVMETLLASVLLAARVWTARRALRDQPEAAHRLHEAWRMLLWFVGPFSLACALMLGGLAFIEADKGRLQGWATDMGDRARWMALVLCASAVLDSVVAPVRSVHWLETGVSWQGSRTAILLLAVLLGWPIILFMGTAQGFLWTFFALRLLSDLGSLRPGERERIRTTMFGERLTGPPTIC